MACINRNTDEYKAIRTNFKTDFEATSMIQSWQRVNKTDNFPTVEEAKEYSTSQKAAMSLKNREFSKALLGNLSRLGIGSMYQGKFYVNNSSSETWDQSTWEYNNKVLEANLERARRYLRINNIKEEAVTFRRTPKAYEVIVNDGMFTPEDLIASQKNNTSTHSVEVVKHLANLFPQINIEVVSVKQAQEYYDSLPESQKSNVPFNKIRSFYVNGSAVLIKGRVNNDTAIEEILHPFVDGVFVDNPDLFNNLLNESKKAFPVLSQQIQDSYTELRGFSNKHRDLELVTQVLSRHFRSEYETNPTKTFKQRVKEFLQWFSELIKNFGQYLTGKPLVFKASIINPNAKMSDIAKLLNTSDIQFKLERIADMKVRYNLSPEMQKMKDFLLDRASVEGTSAQTETIKAFYNLADVTKTDSEGNLVRMDNLALSAAQQLKPNVLVVLDEKTHTYLDVINGDTYMSATTAIKGPMSEQDQINNKLNLEVGNEFDLILNAAAVSAGLDSIKDKIKLLDPLKAAEAYGYLYAKIRELEGAGGIAIPQVTLYDIDTKIAGTADIIIVMPDGKLKVIDLKTSKNSSKRDDYDGKDWNLKNNSLLKQKGEDKLSTKGQHNLQVNMYRRMLENMGYEVGMDASDVQTLHIKVGITGKGTEQVFDGTFVDDGTTNHPMSSYQSKLNKLIPSFKNINADAFQEARQEDNMEAKIDPDNFLNPDEAVPEDIPDVVELTEFAVISGQLDAYELALVAQDEAISRIKSSVFINKDVSTKQARSQIAQTLAAIAVSRQEGRESMSAMYTQVLQDGLKSMRNFREYISDPKNFGEKEYIGYVLNFNRFLETYRGLYELADTESLNATQRALTLNLLTEANKLKGTKNNEGLINESITNFIKEVLKNKSTKDMSETELEELVTSAKDISLIELGTGDLATSPDRILQIIDKIYKAQKQKLLDRLEARDNDIRARSARLQKLSPEKDPQKLYTYMLEFDENGEPTGNYVKRIGQFYYNEQARLRANLIDENGEWKVYKDVTDINNARKEDIAYNIQLAKDKAEYAKFMSPETKGLNNSEVDGEYHKYTKEFKEARKKYEYYVPQGERGFWLPRSGQSKRAYEIYKRKYYKRKVYDKAERIDGKLTGVLEKNKTAWYVKEEYIKVRDISRSGKSLLNEKYEAIMNPTDELGRAQKAFYEMFVKYYEEEMLTKLPMGQRNLMVGKVPLQRARLYQNLKNKPNIVTRLFAGMSRSIRNLTTSTTQQRVILTDEQGYLVDQLPIFYTGVPRTEKDLQDIEAKIDDLIEKRKKGKITMPAYEEQIKILRGKRNALENKPSLGELNLDLGTALIKFNAMAEHYEVMGEVEDTIKAMIHVLKKRTYTPATDKQIFKYIKGKLVKTGIKKEEEDYNVVRRAKKWMHMVFYDDDDMTRNLLEKISDGLVSYSSLSYVAFNPFGNFNNYVLGRINNNIEMLGGRFFNKKNYLRASYEFNKRALPDLIKRTSMTSTLNTAGDLVTGNVFSFTSANVYDPRKPLSKYEAFVDYMRMMDPSTDIRESGRQGERAYESYFRKAAEFGYILQDAAEYNVQTKVGMAMVMDTMFFNPETGDELSMYDAFDFQGNQELKLKEGYTKIKLKNGDLVDFTDDFRYDLRNKIREVNKEIHGNYAREDRMVIQAHSIGRLAAQFHKWVAPAIKARFRKEYYNENLGHMEGRYISFFRFMRYAFDKIRQGQLDFGKYGEGFKEAYGYTGDGSQTDQYAESKLLNTYRTLGEIGIMFTTVGLSMILEGLYADDDDDSDFERKLENFLRYQTDRTYRELILFVPIPGTGGLQQMYQMFKSPIPATRTLGEFGEALELTVRTPLAALYQSDEEFKANSKVVYQRGDKKGQLKLSKNWKDAIPILYAIQKWDSYNTVTNFFIK